MTRVLVLAPGDLIAAIKTELSADGIRFEIREDGRVPASAVAEERTNDRISGGGSDAIRGADRDSSGDEKSKTSHSGSAAASDVLLPTGAGRRDKDDAATENRNVENGAGRDAAAAPSNTEVGSDGNARKAEDIGDVGEKRAKGDVRDDLGLRSKRGDATDRRGTEDEEKNRDVGTRTPGKTMVLTKAIAAAILGRSGVEVSVLEDAKGKVSVLHLSNAVGKHLNLTPDDIREQTDALSHLKKKIKKEKNDVEIVRIESEAKFQSLYPSVKHPEVGKMSGVGMVTNKKEYVPQASVMFTAPTGDPLWKDVAREAMKRSNIRAYVHDVTKNNMPPHEALLTLIRSL
ncbi:VP6 protein [Corriparta virus]|uniref:VP6 protein n=1 Tax=Corriparta virus TaxID=40053 RepID=T1SQC8_9REOV|nr:VP6 protein [Corriparta virus]AGT51062.1 VP6 protein [Corriparta virus]